MSPAPRSLPSRLRRRGARTSADLRFRYRSGHGRLPQFAVIGTGRCGTRHASGLLSAAGILCGHEAVFTPFGVQRGADLVADASWHAVPFVAELGVPSIHLVRRPLDVVNSFLAIGFFRPWSEQRVRPRPAREFADRYFRTTGDEVADAVRWCVEWNHRCERVAFARVALGDADGLLAAAERVVGRPRLRHDGDGPGSPSTSTNARSEQPYRVDDPRCVTYDELPDDAMADALRQLSQRYGYD